MSTIYRATFFCYMASCVKTCILNACFVFFHVATETGYNQQFHCSLMILRADIAYVSILELPLGFFGTTRPKTPQRDARTILL